MQSYCYFYRLIVITSLLLVSGCIPALYNTAEHSKRFAEIKYWKSKATKGDVEAQYKVASLYCCGERPYYDNIKALHWYCKAAKNGQRDAQFEVAQHYENSPNFKGSIVPKDEALAYAFYSIAEDNHHPDAGEYREKLGLYMTEEDRKEGEHLASRYPRIWCENPRK